MNNTITNYKVPRPKSFKPLNNTNNKIKLDKSIQNQNELQELSLNINIDKIEDRRSALST